MLLSNNRKEEITMAKTVKNYKVISSKKIIKVDMKNITEEESAIVKNYVSFGYTVEEWNRSDTKSPSKDEMISELKGISEEIAKDFEICLALKTKSPDEEKAKVKEIAKKYNVKTTTKAGKEYAGYFIACQIYSTTKKKQEEENK
jgi:L-arabinose isomerase